MNFLISRSYHITRIFSLIFFSFVTYIFIDYSPSILEGKQPDSSGYIIGDPLRPSIYHYIIKSLSYLGIDLFFFQKTILSISIVCLCYFLRKQKINIFVIIIFYFFLTLNFYYTSFAKTVLSESILFSLINFTVLCLIKINERKSQIILGLLLGMIFALKPIGIIIAIIILFFSIILLDKKINFLTIIFCFLLPIILESHLFYKNHDKRHSLLPITIAGKLFVLSGKNSFDIEKYPSELKPILRISKNEYSEVHSYLSTIKNPFLRSELLSDYEAVAQFQTFKLKKIIQLNYDKSEFYKKSNLIAYNLVKNNFLDLFTLSFSHYLGNWSIGSKFIFFERESLNKVKEIPKIVELRKSSGPITLPRLELLFLAQLFFIFLFLVLTFFTLFTFFNLIKERLFLKNKKNIFDILYIFLVQTYLIVVSIVNISTPRYLMVVYPILLLIVIRSGYLFLSLTKKS